jgi:hypothetical protein
MKDKACERYEHTLAIKVTTQFPTQGIENLIQQMLGPWCVDVILVETKDTENV